MPSNDPSPAAASPEDAAPRRMLHVATVSVTLRSFLLDHADHLRSKGWRVDGMARGVEACAPCRESYDRVFEIEWSRNPLDIEGALKAGRRIREVVAENDYDVVHVHTPIAAFVTRLALRRRSPRTKLVYTAHGFHFFRGASPLKSAVFRTMERLAAPFMDRLVVINSEDADAARRLRLAPQHRIDQMPGIGVDLSKYSRSLRSPAAGQSLRDLIRADPNAPVFLSVAELAPRKRVEDVLAALAHVPAGRLVVVGEGKQRSRLEEMAGALDIAGRVSFLGYRDDVPVLMAGATALVLVSSQEGLPRCVLEAMAIGLPIIGSDVRGTRDLLSSGGGVLVPLGDIGALADAMRLLATDRASVEALGRQGAESAAEYRIERVTALHDALYDRLLQNIEPR